VRSPAFAQRVGVLLVGAASAARRVSLAEPLQVLTLTLSSSVPSRAPTGPNPNPRLECP
jgi:hypothetical protein